jgi:hypothetical protein
MVEYRCELELVLSYVTGPSCGKDIKYAFGGDLGHCSVENGAWLWLTEARRGLLQSGDQ